MSSDTQYDDPYAEIPVKDFSYTQKPDQSKKPKFNNRSLIIVGAVGLVVIILALAAIVLLHHKTKAPKKNNPSESSQSSSFGLSFNPSKSYSSNNFNLSVNYPSSWSVNENNTSLTILSQETALKNTATKSVNGKILVSVFNQGGIPTAFGNNQSVAVLNSVNISYTNPSPNQSAKTYLSFVQYPATTAKGGLDAIFVTGNDGYSAPQDIPNADINNIDPLVVISFLQCTNTSCSSVSNLTLPSSEWNNQGFSNLIDSIVKSFVFN